jgi:hypothetical protein
VVLGAVSPPVFCTLYPRLYAILVITAVITIVMTGPLLTILPTA